MADPMTSKWEFYDGLIREIPESVIVSDVCVGLYWTYVEATAADGRLSMGIAYTMTGGGRALTDGFITGRSLREVAGLAKSWNWREAVIGVAALNAWYSTYDHVAALGGVFDEPYEQEPHGAGSGIGGLTSLAHINGRQRYRAERSDPFFFLKEDYAGKKITVVGHFPWLDKVADVADLTILERNPHEADGDTPDPGCEYIIPTQDFVLMTGVTIINKTAPRLIELARDATCVILGPSAVAARRLFDYGVDIIAGRVVIDHERAKMAVKQDASFGAALQMYAIDKRGK